MKQFLNRGTFVFIALLGILGLSLVSAGSCDFTEFSDDDTEYIFGDSSYNIRADSNQQIEYSLRRGATFIGGGGSVSQCKSFSFSRWKSGTLDPRERASFSLFRDTCYKAELDFFDCLECREGREDCDREEFLVCEDGKWESQGEIIGECDVECFDGDAECRGTTFYTCDDFEWDKEGKVSGECGVECISSSDCSGNDVCENNRCEQNKCDFLDCDRKCENGKKFPEGRCDYSTQKCVFQSPQSCEFGCDGDQCADDPCEGVTCEDKCSGNQKKFLGYCSKGSCVYQSETCDFGCGGDLCKQNPCLGVDTSDRCEGGKWKNEGVCNNGNVVFGKIDTCQFGCQGEPVPLLALITGGDWCRDSPCEGVVCDDYCSGTTKVTGGVCNSGKCVYGDEVKFNEACGHVPFYKGTSFMVGVTILVIILLLVGFMVFRSRSK